MGTITESFGNLSEFLLTGLKTSKDRGAAVRLIQSHLLSPYLPSGTRHGTGTITDIKDRQAGPIDLVVSSDNFPAFSEGQASTYMADGVLFCLQVKDWKEHDLTEFGSLALQIKKLERKKTAPLPCLAVSFGLLPLPELMQFLNSPGGQPVDGILCVGHHLVLRNSQGWYGDAVRVPFVTETSGPEALKAFTFFLMQLAQSANGLSFGLADYQHL